MRHCMPVLAAAATVLSSAPAHADLGDQLFKLLPGDGAAFDVFGQSVGVSGPYAVIGAAQHADNGDFSGSAYLFDTATGQQVFKLLPADGDRRDAFGYSVAISGLNVIVGASQNDDNGVDSGSAYIFNTTIGQQIHKLLPADGEAGDWFGISVDISGSIAIIGASHDGDNGGDSGSAYIFESTTGQQLFKLLPNDGQHSDRFGDSVAISGTTAIVGSVGDDDNGNASGSAYLFDTTTGLQIAKLLPNDGQSGNEFGRSVAIAGTTAIVGAPRHRNKSGPTGAAYLFDTTTGLQIGKLLPSETGGPSAFSWSVAISGTTAIVGYATALNNNELSGSAYLFDTTTGQQVAKLVASDGADNDQFGFNVAISGDTAIVGAYLDDDNGNNSGSAYLFTAGSTPCPGDIGGDGTVGVADLLAILAAWGPCPGCPEDIDGDGIVNFTDLLAVLGNWGSCP